MDVKKATTHLKEFETDIPYHEKITKRILEKFSKDLKNHSKITRLRIMLTEIVISENLKHFKRLTEILKRPTKASKSLFNQVWKSETVFNTS